VIGRLSSLGVEDAPKHIWKSFSARLSDPGLGLLSYQRCAVVPPNLNLNEDSFSEYADARSLRVSPKWRNHESMHTRLTSKSEAQSTAH
jgi:hypothetical protein